MDPWSIDTAIDLLLRTYSDHRKSEECIWRLNTNSYDACIYDIGGKRWLVLQGSREFFDWVRNFRFLPWSARLSLDVVPEKGETRYYHAGFLSEAKAIWRYLEKFNLLRTIDIVCGHSRGAAMAAIIAPSLGVRALCFESPRYLFRFSRDHKNASMVTHIDLSEDIVTKIPLLLYRRYKGAKYITIPGKGHSIQTVEMQWLKYRNIIF